MTDYTEKFQDMRWQKLRLKVFERDNWNCRMCGETEGSFHCHHLYYNSDTEPWDYPMNTFKTLCSDCHEKEKGKMNNLFTRLTNTVKAKGFLSTEAEVLITAIEDMIVLKDFPLQMMAVSVILKDEALIKRWMKKVFFDDAPPEDEDG